jgi:uncharacterized protein YecE (DUF72 family)
LSPAVRVDPVRFGTSSFSAAGWVGTFYPEGMKSSEFLTHYAQRFNTVEVDSTYYRIPGKATVDRWADVTPPGFLFSLKFPGAIVHAGTGATPDAARLLAPDATYGERDLFLEVTQRLGAKCGVCLLQFPYLSRKVFSSVSPFLEKLDRFLGDLPRERRFAVEVRNRQWLKPELAALCSRHGVALATADQAWMPRPWEFPADCPPVTASYSYARLVGDRREIEALTKVWDREVIDRTAVLEKWAEYLIGLSRSGVTTLVYVNNHFAGFAPGTARRLMQLYQARAQQMI